VQLSSFNAFCPFELGDKVRGISGTEHTITDIASIHSLKKQTVEFVYEFDNCGQYRGLKIQERGNA
jgi:hypothetical protein